MNPCSVSCSAVAIIEKQSHVLKLNTSGQMWKYWFVHFVTTVSLKIKTWLLLLKNPAYNYEFYMNSVYPRTHKIAQWCHLTAVWGNCKNHRVSAALEKRDGVLTGDKESRASLGSSLQFVLCSTLLTVSSLQLTAYCFTLCLKASSSVEKTSK